MLDIVPTQALKAILSSADISWLILEGQLNIFSLNDPVCEMEVMCVMSQWVNNGGFWRVKCPE